MIEWILVIMVVLLAAGMILGYRIKNPNPKKDTL